jgi:DNA-binding transcriptional regulator YiaG
MQSAGSSWKKPMSKKLSFKEALERQDGGPTESRPRTAFPAAKVHLRRTDSISRPIDLARQLVSCGLSLRKAHEAVNRLAEGETVALELTCADSDHAIDRLAKLGIDARRVEMPTVDARHIREIFGLTQAEFADRFLLNIDTIRNWEQGRNAPDPSARLLLKVIEEYPQVIEAILSGVPPSKKGNLGFRREGGRRRGN